MAPPNEPPSRVDPGPAASASVDGQTLVEQWLKRLKNNKPIAIFIFVSMLFLAFVQFFDGLTKVRLWLRPSPPVLIYRHSSGYFESAGDGRWVEHISAAPNSLVWFTESSRDSRFLNLTDRGRLKDGDEKNPLLLRIPIKGGAAQWSWTIPLSWTDLYVVAPERKTQE
jgi:hypothetical protein